MKKTKLEFDLESIKSRLLIKLTWYFYYDCGHSLCSRYQWNFRFRKNFKLSAGNLNCMNHINYAFLFDINKHLRSKLVWLFYLKNWIKRFSGQVNCRKVKELCGRYHTLWYMIYMIISDIIYIVYVFKAL